MSDRLPIEAAEGVFRDLGGFAVGGTGIPEPARLLDAVRRFAAVEFAVCPNLPEQDGFLFQYAAVTTFGDTGFVLGFVRQFEVVDPDNEDHVGFVHLIMEYDFPAHPTLDGLGHHEDWWFRGDDEPFEVWFDRVSDHPAWRYVDLVPPHEFVIRQEWV